MNAIKEINLAGVWGFTPEGGKRDEIQIPGGGWLKQGFVCEAGTYERYITIPDTVMPQVTRLEFGAVNHHAEYYIGVDEKSLQKIYDEVTAFTPQIVNLTEHVQPGRTYLLRIFVRAFRNGRPIAPHWANWCECTARGIFRDAYIRVYPEVFISGTFVKTHVSQNMLRCDVWVTNSSDTNRTLAIGGEFFSWNGDEWDYPELPDSIFTVNARGKIKLTLGHVDWTPGKESWWWPNVPYREGYRTKLHVLKLILREGKNIIHTANTRFGFREIKQSGKYYELNGVRVNFRGDNLQVANYDRIDYGGKGDAIDTFPGFLPPLDGNPGWPKAVDNFLRLNFNVQREHMGPWTPYMIDTCDEVGLMLIGESASRLDNFDRENGRGFHEVKCLKDIIKRDKNHPSIIRWSSVNEPQCDDPEYHLELYEAIKFIDNTRPVSEDIWSIDYLKSRPDEVFKLLLDKDDFSWFEHYISNDDNGKVIHDCTHYNDAVLPLEDRPFGLGEANLNCLSTPMGLTCFATTIAILRAKNASDIRPYVLLSNWASSIPGVETSDFTGEEGRHPEYGEDNLPEPWSFWKIQLLQKACSPFLAIDCHYWYINRKSNASGSFPVVTPAFKINSEVTREIVVFNDDFSGTDIELHWNIRTGSASNRIYDEGCIKLNITPGFMGRADITFKTPDFNNVLVLTLEVIKDGIIVFKDDATVYEAVDEKTYTMQEFLGKLAENP